MYHFLRLYCYTAYSSFSRLQWNRHDLQRRQQRFGFGSSQPRHISGYMVSSNTMKPVLMNELVSGATSTVTDTIRVNLWLTSNLANNNNAALANFHSVVVLNTNGTVTDTFPPQVAGSSYWVQIIHR